MKKLLIALLIAPFCVFAADKGAKPEKADKYQVTGSVTEVSDAKIVVMKGTERHEFVRNADTKVAGGELKVGSKITVKYVMTAASVEVKADDTKGDKKDAAKPAPVKK